MWKHGVQLGYSSDRSTYGVLEGTYEKGCPIGVGKGNLSAFECARAVSTILCIHEDSTGMNSFLGSASVQAGSPVSALSLGTLVVGLAIGVAVGIFATNFWNKRRQADALLGQEDKTEGNDTSE